MATSYTTGTMLQASIASMRDDTSNPFDPLHTVIRSFATDVWEPILAESVEAAPERGMCGQAGDVQLLTYVLAGRVMLTFGSADCYVSTVAEEKGRPSRMGLQGIDGTIGQAIDLINTVREAILAGEFQMQSSKDVHLDVALADQ